MLGKAGSEKDRLFFLALWINNLLIYFFIPNKPVTFDASKHTDMQKVLLFITFASALLVTFLYGVATYLKHLSDSAFLGVALIGFIFYFALCAELYSYIFNKR
jgi:hypothetical protein